MTDLNQRPGIKQNNKLNMAYVQFGKLLSELRKRKLSDKILNVLNHHIEDLNSISDSDKKLRAQIRIHQAAIVRRIEKELKIVCKNHYRNTWMGVGMAAFGIPFGVAFAMSLDNMAFIGMGIPFGFAIGIAIGTKMDQKAAKEGRQLDLELK